jgi:uncharacterized protein (DUF2235 family)
MAKKIIYCCDGTWNGPATDTNVYRFYKTLIKSAAQQPFYDEGVGRAGGFLSRLRGGAFGAGLVENVREGYEKIANCFVPGDSIYLFGFSRGAYTARSLGGMIAYCGLPEGLATPDQVANAFRAYRARDGKSAWADRPADLVDARVEMVGVWDTVGTLGIPGAFFGSQDAKYRFLDTSLHPAVQAGYHAVAIDERRKQFAPTLWSRGREDQIIEQVWFAGVHCDVGGGGQMAGGLDAITLGWMLDKATRHGVEIDPASTWRRTPLPRESACVPMRRSWKAYWGRRITRAIAPRAAVANSVEVRIIGDDGYRPKQLPDLSGRTSALLDTRAPRRMVPVVAEAVTGVDTVRSAPVGETGDADAA